MHNAEYKGGTRELDIKISKYEDSNWWNGYINILLDWCGDKQDPCLSFHRKNTIMYRRLVHAGTKTDAWCGGFSQRFFSDIENTYTHDMHDLAILPINKGWLLMSRQHRTRKNQLASHKYQKLLTSSIETWKISSNRYVSTRRNRQALVYSSTMAFSKGGQCRVGVR